MKKMCRNWEVGADAEPPALRSAGAQPVHTATCDGALGSPDWQSRPLENAMIRSSCCVLAPLLLAISPALSAAGPCKAQSGTHVLPLVELYTAEGCNDCPPADRWLSELSRKTQPTQAALLAFHVDYWDEFGWPDRFADHAYSQRQDLRITLAHKKVTYTPQVMIGKDIMVKWSNASRLQSVLEQARSQPAPIGLAMQLTREADKLRVGVNTLRPAGDADGAEPALVWLALYQDGLTSKISAGENKGLTLHHDRVVRALLGPWRVDARPLAAEVEIPLPADADAGRMGLVLFAESGKTGAGMQALAMPLSTCPASG